MAENSIVGASATTSAWKTEFFGADAHDVERLRI
jgi:hypothetical protein